MRSRTLTVLNHSVFQPEAVQTLYMRVLHLLYRFRPECHSMVSTSFGRMYPGLHAIKEGALHWTYPERSHVFLFVCCYSVDSQQFSFCSFCFSTGSTFGEHSVSSISWGGDCHHQCLHPHVCSLAFSPGCDTICTNCDRVKDIPIYILQNVHLFHLQPVSILSTLCSSSGCSFYLCAWCTISHWTIS